MANSFRNINNAPVVKINFHIPGSKSYGFYESGRFIKEYCKNAKIHKARDTDNYDYSKYMQDQEGHDNTQINCCQSDNATDGKICKGTIVFDSIISVCEEDTKYVGLKNSQKNISKHYFDKFCESHKFDKTQWAYFSALHENTDNDHLHVVFYQPVICEKPIDSNFLNTQKYAKFPKDSKEFKEYIKERKNVITAQSCIKDTIKFVGNRMDRILNCASIKELLNDINAMKDITKTKIKSSNEEKILVNLNNYITKEKGIDGRLQYANILKRIEQKNPDIRLHSNEK
jgi:hypothetical protein